MKKSIVFLTPSSADKKGELVKGELVEMEFESEPVQYLEPFAENDDTAKLRHQVHEAQSKLQHAKARGKGVAEAQKALEAAKSAAAKAHREQQRGRDQQKTGIDYGAPSPVSRDTRQFAEIVSYADNDNDPNDTTGRTFDDEADDELEAQVMALVTKLEEAMSSGAPQAKIDKLAATIRALKEGFYYPGNQPQDAPPRKRHIDQNPGGEADTGAIEAPFPGAKKLKDAGPNADWKSRQAAAPVKMKTGWQKFLADLDDRLAKRALSALRTAATHSKKICCQGEYKCARCRAAAAT